MKKKKSSKTTTICLPEETFNDKELFKDIRYLYGSFSNFIYEKVVEFNKKERGKYVKQRDYNG